MSDLLILFAACLVVIALACCLGVILGRVIDAVMCCVRDKR
jgi:hypothetical protein